LPIKLNLDGDCWSCITKFGDDDSRLAHKLIRIVKDYERSAQTLAHLHAVAFVCIMAANAIHFAVSS